MLDRASPDAPDGPGNAEKDVMPSIGFLVFPDVQQLDLTGPYEVFASWPEAELHLVWKDRAPLRASTGLQLTPTTSFADCPPLDVICAPGGRGINALLGDDEVLAFLRQQARTARYVTSVCTGALALGAAGLLAGKRATTHWAYRDLLAPFGATATHARVERDGALVTGGGVTAGIDFALALVAEMAGRETAESIQLLMEYAPAPPFDSGSPETAPPAVVEKFRARSAENRAERERLVAAAAARLAKGPPSP
jgi:cyclohexyl-isocyanide hydratase